MATAALRERLDEYGSVHTTYGNVVCHWVGIPLIVVAVLGALARVPITDIGGFALTGAELVLAVALVYYARLDAVLAAIMIPVVIPLDLAGRALPLWANGALFVIGWIFQLVGHAVYEKKSPAFLRNLVHLLIGPLFLLAKAVRRA
jgi:uncharacterized membrane protein YGL010W